MIFFIDTDILLDIALDRKPFADDAVQLLKHIEQERYPCFIAWHTISNLYYLLTTEKSDTTVRNFIQHLLQFIEVAPTNTESVRNAFDLSIADFEDALQITAAIACKANVIITRNTRDFRKSPIPVKTAKQARAMIETG